MNPPGNEMRPRIRLWLENEDGSVSFGAGRWRLLEAIDREGSLTAAAASLGMSYRKAWGSLRKTETALQMRLIEKKRGGAEGGSTVLTDDGRRWMRFYRNLHLKIEKTVAKEYEKQKDTLYK